MKVNIMSRLPLYALSLVVLGLNVGCAPDVEVIDLNRVLDVFQETLDEVDGEDKSSVDSSAIAEVQEGQDAEGEKQKAEFLGAFANNLNEAKLISSPIGVKFAPDGALHGFKDADKNNAQSTTEPKLFQIVIDEDRNRLIASDTGGYHRDHSYRPRLGFFSGYMFGSMMGSRNSYFTGARAGLKPDYSRTQMSPKTYHSAAVSKAKTAARAARARTGSKGISFGK